MKFQKTISSLSLVALLLILGGCASIAKAPSHLDKQAKEFRNNPKFSQVYLYRNEILGAALSMPVTVNGQLVGNTGPTSYFKFDLPAGRHTFTSQGGKSSLTINTKLGENYFIWQEMKVGILLGGSQLQLVSASQGKSGVLQCTLIDSPEITAKPKLTEERIKCTPGVGCKYE